jgi:preprotein translocase subunit SecG
MEDGKKWIVGILVVVFLVICIALVVLGQRKIAFSGLMMEFVGLGGILLLLGLYNRKYK